MLEKYIIFGVAIYFLGLILSAVLAFFTPSFKKGTQLFIAANVIGFLAAVGYFLDAPADNFAIAHFEWFFRFAPRLNFLAAIFFAVVSGVSALVGVYSLRYLELYEKEYDPRLVQFLISGFVLGMQGVLLANNAFAFLLFWEVMSVVSFFLVMSDKKPESVRAAFLYFVMTHLGASAILGGFLILGGGSFFFNLEDIRQASENLSPAMNSLAFLLFVFGFGSKAGLVPFHVWLPEAHPQAPSNVSAMMSGLMLKIAVYGFIMIILSMVHIPAWAGLLVLFIGLLSGVAGALYAVVERGIKKTFAYSSIENMGLIFTMLGLTIYLLSLGGYGTAAHFILAFAVFHAINHSLFKTGLFLSSGVVMSRTHTKRLEMMGGIAKIMPFFSLAFLVSILASLPLPLFGTFYGEWGFIQNILSLLGEIQMSSGGIVLLLVILSSVALVSGLAIFAMVKVFSISMLGLSRNAHMDRRDEKTDYLMTAPIMMLGLGVILLGFLARTFIGQIVAHFQSFEPSIPSYGAAPLPIDISSVVISASIVALGVLVYLIQKVILTNKKERRFGTWDCGQDIDATMQYTATAFSAPIRFFFLTFIGRKKVMQSVAVVPTNPWIRKYSFNLSIRPKWNEALYAPIARGLLALAEKIRLIQSGRIQYYILFLLLALIVTLIFAV